MCSSKFNVWNISHKLFNVQSFPLKVYCVKRKVLSAKEATWISAQTQESFESRLCGHQEALSLARHVLGRLEANPGKNVLFTAPAVRGLGFPGPMQWHSMNSLLQHLLRLSCRHPLQQRHLRPPPHPGSPPSLCDPRRGAGVGDTEPAEPQGAAGDNSCLQGDAVPGLSSTLCPPWVLLMPCAPWWPCALCRCASRTTWWWQPRAWSCSPASHGPCRRSRLSWQRARAVPKHLAASPAKSRKLQGDTHCLN